MASNGRNNAITPAITPKIPAYQGPTSQANFSTPRTRPGNIRETHGQLKYAHVLDYVPLTSLSE